VIVEAKKNIGAAAVAVSDSFVPLMKGLRLGRWPQLPRTLSLAERNPDRLPPLISELIKQRVNIVFFDNLALSGAASNYHYPHRRLARTWASAADPTSPKLTSGCGGDALG
jgi:hypothetical protein